MLAQSNQYHTAKPVIVCLQVVRKLVSVEFGIRLRWTWKVFCVKKQ